MKKIIFVLFVLFNAIAYAEESKISFTNEDTPFAFTFDKNELSQMPKDKFKISASYNVKGLFEIYASNDTQNWIHLGNIVFEKYGDLKTLKTKEKVKNFRYYCIISQEEKIDYEIICYNNDILVKAKKDDVLRINNQIIEEGFYILDYTEIDAADYFKLDNTTSKSNFRIKLYAFDTKKENWQYAGEGTLKEYGDVDTIRSNLQLDIDNYRIVALISENKMKFTCRASERSDDLYIELCELKNEPDFSENIIISDIEEQLIKIKNLYDKGYINDEEYKLKKAQILGL